MHFVVTDAFMYGGVSYQIGDGIYGASFTQIVNDTNKSYWEKFVVAVSDGDTSISPPPNTGGTPDMPIVTGYYEVPASASTNGILAADPTLIVQIRNTISTAQPAVLNLFDANDPSQISSAHLIFSAQLGASQLVPMQVKTTVGLVYEITAGDGGATALSSTGGIDIDHA